MTRGMRGRTEASGEVQQKRPHRKPGIQLAELRLTEIASVRTGYFCASGMAAAIGFITKCNQNCILFVVKNTANVLYNIVVMKCSSLKVNIQKKGGLFGDLFFYAKSARLTAGQREVNDGGANA